MTKRKVANKIEELESDSNDDSGDPLIISYSVVDETPHPELTVQPHPDTRPDMRKVATPNVIPNSRFDKSVVFIDTCKNDSGEGWYNACELWDSMSEEQLQEEYQYRKANNEPIPEALAKYE
jgi:hypothetical protein